MLHRVPSEWYTLCFQNFDMVIRLKIIRNIMMGVLEDVASGIAYIHEQFWFHNFRMSFFLAGFMVSRWVMMPRIEFYSYYH